ncbi:LacI family DNA-binding transcriptional regulator [Stenotrophomonas sp. HITSZ_GD]|uniref:LacI family DNA-binding transcriptional regulator n=1 Tax=Stenotrophomonas sp. HITSZ_GD TaxID=3037248 RepID=UPI00240D7F14|nr:LacI family DNA-binding transcriptional regulator [Stenotrophomonas sp. HITSZ_GD]MDG2524290.1 LacI family DNA-binding transcriptional regulator [Stenotrophomonas sp. HITSZ_GD]
MSTRAHSGGNNTGRAGGSRAVTVTDIARAVGVSRATVSLVLRGSPLVHADTRARVHAELQRQRYVYNRAAANLRRRTSTIVALVINDLSNPFFAEFAAGVDEALGEQGYVTLLGNTGESPRRQQAVLASLMEHAPAGVILSPAEHSEAASLRAVMGAAGNVLLFNREPAGHEWDFLALDNAHGAQLATRHLIELGHRDIAFFGGHADSSSCQQRRSGYVAAMAQAGLPVREARMVECAPTRPQAAAATQALFETAERPTAAVCYNDNVAMGLMLGLFARGVQPGRDFSVTGFDDIPEAALSTPALTTLAVDPRARGRQAAQLLLQRIGAPDASVARTIAPVELRVRQSSAPPPG